MRKHETAGLPTTLKQISNSKKFDSINVGNYNYLSDWWNEGYHANPKRLLNTPTCVEYLIDIQGLKLGEEWLRGSLSDNAEES